MPLRFRAWLRANSTTETSKTWETSRTDTKIAPTPSTPRSPPPPYEACMFQGATAPPVVSPPPISDQATLPLLRANNLRRQDETRILKILDHVLKHANDGLARRGDNGKTAAAIADAVQEGSIAAAVTVRKTFAETRSGKLEDDVSEGCRKVADAVIAATAAASVANRLSTAGIAADCISFAAQMAANNKKGELVPLAVANQLGFTAAGVAAAISARIITGSLCLGDIPLPSRSQFLLET
ncbi:hypothetical protein X797_007470 [Metarhizium robertsii]|uniref:Uncharacterized protein n=2 Tax=Metarhizium robertsii TaxID=568076 RepID=E9F5Q1_METRA|nr:uncharacterized protein MAA_07600 [Metarhizium robertsii ARSEF 23]EFY97054.1 hypothetical protein MAA_07600 [Metarhizium robertsii ARSEF 23]EXU99335.1 hypothetical protein X797_007470 [Metarhizium robertsii]